MSNFKAVVSYINFFDNELVTKIVEVPEKNWKLACIESGVGGSNTDERYIDWLLNIVSDDMEEAKFNFYDGEMQMTVTWID